MNRGLVRFPFLMSTLLLACSPLSAEQGCPPAGYSRERLDEIKQNGFEISTDEERNALAVGLLACVSDPNPALRDGIVYEGLTTWLRGGNLSTGTLDTLYNSLVAQIRSTSDPGGFQQPFAALILSEVVRTDRIAPWFSAERREEIVGIASTYLRGVKDYRGFSETEGWRHGVAHASDLVLQLVLNPQVGALHIQTLMESVASQVAPEGELFYVYGEPGRLARAVFYAYQRGVVNESWWSNWFESIANPGPLESWSASFSSQAGLARRHNTTAFLLAIHFNASSAGDERSAALKALSVKALESVLGG